MVEVIPSILWAAVAAYAVWVVQRTAATFLAQREPKENMGVALLKAELEKLRADLTKTSRVASSAALAAGLREESK